jgi:hypothetical protein
MPLTLFAATEAPTPLLQMTMPRSTLSAATARARDDHKDSPVPSGPSGPFEEGSIGSPAWG